jgi:osmotically inducible protein OsmC
MALAERSARSIWDGDLLKGSGTVTFGTGAIAEQKISWPARTEAPGGKTSPEELIAAAHAACFAMALSNVLAKADHAPERLETSATVTFVPGTGITKSALTVVGVVPGIDEAAFKNAAGEAKVACPVSGALEGNVELTLDARLQN